MILRTSLAARAIVSPKLDLVNVIRFSTKVCVEDVSWRRHAPFASNRQSPEPDIDEWNYDNLPNKGQLTALIRLRLLRLLCTGPSQ